MLPPSHAHALPAQLYLQAHLIWPIFNGCVLKWAARSKGKLLLDDGDGSFTLTSCPVHAST